MLSKERGLNAYELQMLSGSTNMSRRKVLKYREMYLKEGFELPPLIEEPGFAEKMVNFGAAIVEEVVTGFQNVPDDVQKARYDICKACDQLEGDKCRQCGCMMSRKTGWATQACPLGKWSAYKKPEDSQ